MLSAGEVTLVKFALQDVKQVASARLSRDRLSAEIRLALHVPRSL